MEGVARGVDMFDCVMPTRNARNGHYFTSFGTVRIRNSQYARDMDPIEPGCGRGTGGFTRSLRHLDRCNEMLAPMLGTLHNLFYYESSMADIRRDRGEPSWPSASPSTRHAGSGPAAVTGRPCQTARTNARGRGIRKAPDPRSRPWHLMVPGAAQPKDQR